MVAGCVPQGSLEAWAIVTLCTAFTFACGWSSRHAEAVWRTMDHFHLITRRSSQSPSELRRLYRATTAIGLFLTVAAVWTAVAGPQCPR